MADDSTATPARRPAGRPRKTFSGLAGLNGDPIAAAMEGDTLKIAADLSQALDSIGDAAESDVKILIYKISKKGEWEHVKQLQPPIEMTEVLHDLEEGYGPGRYCIRVMASNRVKTNKFVNIAEPKAAANSLLGGNAPLSLPDLIKLLTDKPKDDSSKELFLMMMQMQQSVAAEMAKAQQQSTQLIVTLMSTIMARPDNGDNVLKSAALLKELQGPQQSTKDFLELMAAARDIMGDGGGSGGLMGMAEKMLPALAGLAEQAGRGGQPVQAQPMLAAPPAPSGVIPPPIARASSAMPQPSAPPAADHPILGLVRPDLEFCMSRRHDPELAAELIADTLRRGGITREQVFGLGMELQTAPGGYVAKLREFGIDVGANTAWFESMLAVLADIYTDDSDQLADDPDPAPDPARANGRHPDASDHAGLGIKRKPTNPNPKSGGTPN